MQMALVRGRVFNSAETPGSLPSVIINETLAREFWPNQDPIGQELRFGEQHTVCTIVGVTRDIKIGHLRERPQRQIYVALAQFPSATLGFVVRTVANSGTIATSRSRRWSRSRP